MAISKSEEVTSVIAISKPPLCPWRIVSDTHLGLLARLRTICPLSSPGNRMPECSGLRAVVAVGARHRFGKMFHGSAQATFELVMVIRVENITLAVVLALHDCFVRLSLCQTRAAATSPLLLPQQA